LTHLQVSITRHKDRPFFVRPLDDNPNHGPECTFELSDLTEKPESHVGCYLIIAGASRVQLATKRSDQFTQSTFVGSMDVFVVLFDCKLRRVKKSI
jgi:hypothetical protein